MLKNRNLLICVAIDLDGGNWFAQDWDRIVASLRLGKAGDVYQTQIGSAAFALRRDVVPGTDRPSTIKLDIEPGPDGGFTLLAGRIMQRHDLARRLGIAAPDCDADLYAAAFRILGAECDNAIIGDYSVIQWFPDERRVRLARSPLQAPPLHVWRERNRLVAASLPRSIFAAGVTPRLDYQRLADAGLRNFMDGSRSYYAGLSRVPCGSVQIHRPGGVSTDQFWRPDFNPADAFNSAEEAIEAVREEMRTAVSEALAEVKRPAVALSGGLDSQAVAAFALQQIGGAGKLKSFTSVPIAQWLPKPDPRLIYDERDAVLSLAQMYPALEPSFVTGQDTRFGADIEAMHLLGSWPTSNEMNMHWIHAIHRLAAKEDCGVLLHGEMGESSISFDGHAAFPTWLRRGNWRRLARELQEFEPEVPFWRKLAKWAVRPNLPPPARQMIDRLRGVSNDPLVSWSPLSASHTEARVALSRAAAEGHDAFHFTYPDSATARRAMTAGPMSEGPELDLALRLLHGVERRDPLAYRPLWELCARLPDRMFLREGVDRHLVRDLIDGMVPDVTRDQKQVGIQSADMLGRMQRDRALLLSQLDGSMSKCDAGGLIDFARIRTVLERSHGPTAIEGEKDWLKAATMVPRGLALAHFVRHVEQRNDG